jgi:hypothetical protein
MAKLKNLFKKAASEQWFPMTEIMAKVMKRVESDSTNIPASEIVNIDLKFRPHSSQSDIFISHIGVLVRETVVHKFAL